MFEPLPNSYVEILTPSALVLEDANQVMSAHPLRLGLVFGRGTPGNSLALYLPCKVQQEHGSLQPARGFSPDAHQAGALSDSQPPAM